MRCFPDSASTSRSGWECSRSPWERSGNEKSHSETEWLFFVQANRSAADLFRVSRGNRELLLVDVDLLDVGDRGGLLKLERRDRAIRHAGDRRGHDGLERGAL